MLVVPLYPTIHTRQAGSAGELDRQYLLDYVVYDYEKEIIVLPAGPNHYAVTHKLDGRRIDFTRAALHVIPGARVVACLPHVATLFLPFATSLKEVREEVALAFASYDAKHYDITADLPKYAEEKDYEIQADYRLDEAA